jgi:predicted enzyme related to lactoylglutathione lyase
MPKPITGKFVWYELVSKDEQKAQRFYGDVLGWSVKPTPMGSDTYDMIYAGDQMVGGYTEPKGDREPAHWISYVSVDDVDASAKAAQANGGKVIEAPRDVPEVGRMARIADPLGAEFYVFHNPRDTQSESKTGQGNFFWNELHTRDPEKVLPFYEKVVGFEHRKMDMGPSGAYYIISKEGVDRGGVTAHLAKGVPPHWLPYVYVDQVDDTIAKARKAGGQVPQNAEDIPGVGRFGVVQDPTGAVLAVMKPTPSQSSQSSQ